MLIINHALIGAVGGEVIKNSPEAFAFGAGIHFLLDKIPHFWSNEIKYKYVIATIDCVVSIAFLSMLWFRPEFPRSVFWGALGGASVDFLLIGVPWLYKSAVGDWHVNRQPHRIKPAYLLGEAILITVCLFVLWRLL